MTGHQFHKNYTQLYTLIGIVCKGLIFTGLDHNPISDNFTKASPITFLNIFIAPFTSELSNTPFADLYSPLFTLLPLN